MMNKIYFNFIFWKNKTDKQKWNLSNMIKKKLKYAETFSYFPLHFDFRINKQK